MENNVNQFSISIANDKNDLENCLEFLVKSFSFVQNDILFNSMSSFLYNAPYLKCFVIKKGSQVIGVQTILDRKMLFFGVSFKIAGMSYAAIESSYQNSEVGNLLKTNLFNYLNENSDLCLGFARKALDNYWHPYGFRGVTNFCEITLQIAKVVTGKKNVSARIATEIDIPSLIKWYNESYLNSVGPFIRDKELWRYYLKKISYQSLEILIIIEEDIEIGYCLLNNNYLLEVGFDRSNQNQVFQFLCRKLKNDGWQEIVFKIGASHPLVRNIEKFEFSLFKRYVWRGGHIAKINNVSDFLIRFIPVLELRLLNAKVGEFELSCNKFLFVYTKNSLFVSEYTGENPEICFEKSEWVKLIFGVLPVQSLLGFSGEKNLGIVNILFPECNPQFPELDHF